MAQTLLVFALVAFIGIATPGPAVLLALTNGSRFGLRAPLPGMVGAVLPQLPQPPQYAALALTFAAIDFAVVLAYASAGAQAIRVLRANGVRWLDRICGGALLALADSLALYRRGA